MARGLMQLTAETANETQVTDLSDARAAIRYQESKLNPSAFSSAGRSNWTI
jgi:membrane-bound lytic murein transglycosylase MltF